MLRKVELTFGCLYRSSNILATIFIVAGTSRSRSSGVVEDDWDVAAPSALITHASDELVYPSVRSSGTDTM